MERTHTPVCFQVGLFSRKTSSVSSVTTKNGLGPSHRVDPSPPETTATVQSDVRGGSSTPWGRLKRKHGAHAHTSAHSSRPLHLKNLLEELSYHQKRAWRLARSGPMSTRNDYSGAIRCTGQLQSALGEAKNTGSERTHTPVRFQVGLSS